MSEEIMLALTQNNGHANAMNEIWKE
jgi:hypothetical protein